jgi:hypothetical protein
LPQLLVGLPFPRRAAGRFLPLNRSQETPEGRMKDALSFVGLAAALGLATAMVLAAVVLALAARAT